RPCSEIDAEADAGRLLAAAEGAADAEGRGLADAAAVTDRQRRLAALPARAHRDAAARALGAGGIDRHVEHGAGHRALAVDATVLVVQAAVDVVEAVLERVEAPVDR